MFFMHHYREQIDYFQASSSAFSVNLGRILIHYLRLFVISW